MSKEISTELEEALKEYPRVVAAVDLEAVLDNVRMMKANIPDGTKITAVIKTDAYGHGALEVGRKLENEPYLWGFAVATFEEAKQLREGGLKKPVLILGYVFPYAYEEMAQLGIRPAVFRLDQLEELDMAAKALNIRMPIHIAVDTGMSRIGITPDENGIEFIKKAISMKNLEVEGIFTHFARADESNLSNANDVLKRYTAFLTQIYERTGYQIPIQHCSNSAGIIALMPNAAMNMVRAGVTIYGMWPSDEVDKKPVPIRPVMSLYSHVVYVKTLNEGTPISYGGTFVTTKETRVATIPVGYGDGYPRGLSNKGYVLIRGQKARILGRVCMDQFMVDVTESEDIHEGDKVTLLGADGDLKISAEELGNISGRFNYELTCDINKRVPRAFLGK